ncbi:somatostatin 1.2 [Lampris incognitus]|uniref:somatostatin 1.2 n=1 Tax=Lampris incognitus TaxID=2546036 RepID=UPI0024B60BF7|nr:somatostatin 1.2 [Lampris incognitus]
MRFLCCSSGLVLSALALILFSSGAECQPNRDQNHNVDLDLELRHHRLLQRTRNADLMTQEWSKRAVEELLSQLSLPEGDTQREAEVISMGAGEAPEDSLRMELERSVDPPYNLPPRERKAGCKNFYWKGFTSC